MQVFCIFAVTVSVGVFRAGPQYVYMRTVAFCLVRIVGKGSVKTSGKINRISSRREPNVV